MHLPYLNKNYGSGFYPDVSNPYPPQPHPFVYQIPPSAPPPSPSPSAVHIESDMRVPNDYEECPICLENCGDHPEGNRDFPKIVARTVCNHYFHDLCLQKHLSDGMNKNCPMCRNPLASRNITTINLAPRSTDALLSTEEPRVEPVVDNTQQVPSMVDSAEATAGLVSAVFLSLAWVSRSIASRIVHATSSIGSSILNFASGFLWPKDVDPISIDICGVQAKSLKEEVNKRMQKQYEAMQLVLTQVASIRTDRSKNPAATFNKIKSVHDKLAERAEIFLRETESLVAELETLSREV